MSQPNRVLPPIRVTSTPSAVGAAIARRANSSVTEAKTQTPRADARQETVHDVTEDEGWTPVRAPKPAPAPKTMTLGELSRQRTAKPAESVNYEEDDFIQESRTVVMRNAGVVSGASLAARMLGGRKR